MKPITNKFSLRPRFGFFNYFGQQTTIIPSIVPNNIDTYLSAMYRINFEL